MAHFPGCNKRWHWPLMLMLVFSLMSGSAFGREQKASDDPPLVFGIAPFMSPMALVKRMAPLRDYLSEALGRTVIIETANDAEEFVRRTLAGRYQLVLTSPVFSLRALDEKTFSLLVSQRRMLAGYFVVMDHSPINSVDQLAGRLVGAPPRVGFLGQLIEPLLSDMHFPPNSMPRIKHFHSHNDAIAALRLGETDASFIVSFMEPHLLSRGVAIRTIYRTGDYPGLNVLAHESMPVSVQQRLRDSLLQLDQTQEGKRLLNDINMPGFRAIEVQELESVRPYLARQLVD